MELKEIINTNNPLMERFKETAPGTYKHCLAVADLCESVGRELELNTEYLVVAAILHDVGKCNNPNFFFENLGDDKNPHDELDPKISQQLISRHVADSVLKLVQLDVPKEILRIISEHHGDTIVRSIYNKAKEVYNGSTVEDHYRYKSLKPSMVSSAVLMCADVVESACRSLHNNNKLEEHKIIVDRLINNLMEDEQLDILKIGELRIIKKVLISEVKDIYHKRLDYEADEDPHGE